MSQDENEVRSILHSCPCWACNSKSIDDLIMSSCDTLSFVPVSLTNKDSNFELLIPVLLHEED